MSVSQSSSGEPTAGSVADDDRDGRVVIADPDTEVRRGLRDVLQDEGGFAVVASAGDGIEALELVTYYRPDIALIGLELPGLDGIALTRRIASEMAEVRVLIYSARDDDEVQLEAFRAGASGFVSRRMKARGAVNAAKGVLRGEAAVSRGLAMSLVKRLRALPESGSGLRPVKSSLTPREWEVADLMAKDLDTRAIAAELVLSEDTVYTHVKHILRKLGVHTRAEAVTATNRMREPGADLQH